MRVEVLPVCISEYAKEVFLSIWGSEIRRTFRCLRSSLSEALCAAAFGTLEACSALVLPPVFASMIDAGIAVTDAERILVCGLILIAASALGLFCGVCARYFAARTSAKLAVKLRGKVYARLQTFDDPQADATPASICGDVDHMADAVFHTLPRIFRMPCALIVPVIAAWTLNVGCGAVFAASVFAFLCIGFGTVLVRVPLARCIRECRGDMPRLMRLQTLHDRISALSHPLITLAFGCAAAALLCLRTACTRGQIVALLLYLAGAAEVCAKSADRIVEVVEAGLCGKRIADFAFPAVPRREHEIRRFRKREEVSA